MAQYKSNNEYYRSADITRPVENIKKILGLSGTADSDYLTGLGKVSRLEGTEMDNRKKQGLWKALTDATGVEGLTLDQILMRHLGKDASDFQGAITGEKEQPFRVDIQRQKAKGAGSKAGVEGILAGLAEQIAKHGMRPDPAEFEGGPAGGRHLYDDAIAGAAANFEDIVRKYGAIKGGSSRGQHKTAAQAEALFKSDIEVEDTQKQYNIARTRVAEKIGEAKTKLAEERTNKVISDMNIGLDIAHEKINNLRQVGLDAALIAQQRGLNLKETNALIKKNVEIAAEKLKGAKADTSKKTTQASSELKKYWALAGELYRKAEKQKAEIRKLKQQTATAESNRRVAELTEAYRVTIKKAQAAQAKSKASTADSKKQMASMDLQGYQEKLKTLKAIREKKLEEGKQRLANAKTEGERKKLDIEIKKELRPLDKQIKDLAIEMADVNIRSKSRESLMKTSSPAQMEREKQLKLEQIKAKQRSNSGSGTSGLSIDQLIDQQLKGGGTSTTRGLPPAKTKKSMPPDPAAKAIFDNLMSVDPQVLKTWTPEEIDSAVAMAKQQFPNMKEARIRRLIQTAQRRSQ